MRHTQAGPFEDTHRVAGEHVQEQERAYALAFAPRTDPPDVVFDDDPYSTFPRTTVSCRRSSCSRATSQPWNNLTPLPHHNPQIRSVSALPSFQTSRYVSVAEQGALH